MHPNMPSSGRPKLSVALIVRDEAKTIADALASVHAIADEMVVLDTGSTDRTVVLAEAAGATVVRVPWADDFAQARNACLQHARGDWVLWLDGSERLEESSAEALRQFVDGEADRGRLYRVLVEIPPLDPAGSAEQAARIRLMPNDPDLHFTGRVAESLFPAAEQAAMDIDLAPGRILRHAVQHDPRRRMAKARRDLELVALEERTSGRLSPRLLVVRGDAYATLDCLEPARTAYRTAIAAAESGSTTMLDAFYGLLPTFDSDPACREEQLKTGLQAIEAFPLDAQLLFAMGNYLHMRGRLDLAHRSFEAALQFGQVDLDTWHLRELREVIAVGLSVIQRLEGDEDAAQATLAGALTQSPHSLRVRRHLLDVLVRQGRESEAVQLAGELPLDAEQREPFEHAVRGACRAALQQWTPALGHLQSAYVAGCRDTICLRWLAVTLLSNGQFEAVRPVLAEWAELEPGSAELRSFLAALDSHAAPAEPAETDRTVRFDLPSEAIAIGPTPRADSAIANPDTRPRQ